MASPPPSPTESRPTPRWGLGDAVLAFVLALLGGVIGQILAIKVTGTKALPDGTYPETTAITLAAVVGQFGVWFGCMAYASRRKGLGSLRADFGFVVDLAADWRVVALGAGFEILAGIVVLPLSHIVHTSQSVVNQLEDAGGAKFALLAVLAVLIAPVVEELFFRGLLLRSLLRRLSAPAAVAVSALIFGLTHVLLDWNARAALPALVALGMVSGIFAVRTGNLSRSILLHAGFNLATVLLLLTNR